MRQSEVTGPGRKEEDDEEEEAGVQEQLTGD